jgi:hypothetical protein
MTTPDDCPDDLSEAVLRSRCSPPDGEFRRAVLMRTLGVVRRRRRLKRCALGVGLLACYLAGIATVAIEWPNGTREFRESQARMTDPTPQSSETPSATRPAPVAPGLRQIAGAELTGYQQWRHAGDECLRERGDISRAVCDYGRALDLASEDERAISPVEDSWLLMALKNAHAKERHYEHPQQN